MSLRILIVDDDLSMRMLLAEYFRRLGFEVEEKESAEEAFEHAVSGRLRYNPGTRDVGGA